jgi:repressor of nif and glnA expression
VTENESIETFAALNKILEEQGLVWLVEAVRREIEEGIIEEASEKDFTQELYEAPSAAEKALAPAYRRSIKKAEFLVRREFTHFDQLRLLVDAVDEVISQGSSIEQDLVRFFKESDGPTDFQFADGGSSLNRRHQEQFDVRSSAVQQLQDLLQELRQEIVQ